MNKEFVRTAAGDKKVLHGLRWLPRNTPKGVIRIVPGMAEHSERYNHVARRFTENGFAVTAHDHRGHGKTDPDHPGFINSTHTDHFELMADDTLHLFRETVSDFPGLPVVMIGHSMGSFLLQRVMQKFPFEAPALPSAIIYSGSNGKQSVKIHAGIRLAGLIESLKGPGHKSSLIHNLTFGAFNKPFEPANSDFAWLSRDTGMVQLYEDDPLCGFLPSVSFYRHLFRGLINLHKHTPFAGIHQHIPILIIAGDHDPVSNMGKGVHRLKKKLKKGGAQKADLKIYPGARHELFNEINRDEVITDVLNWIHKHVDFRK